MDYKTLNGRLAQTLGRPADETATLTDALAKLMTELGGELDSMAVPGFGTFTPVKTDETIVTDEATGVRTLIPPAITLHFQPSVLLRKKLTR